eukprot:TRINITY_DN22361_c0_g1_i1.p2 TRINITY_DN22361_c0_g1~~TRINITY_DN22361_c0_g1_i1.p2  ORF type:complete len:804 (+),score=181.59 TRINITY_DN22361_c0_g1_i1:76-2487(+)
MGLARGRLGWLLLAAGAAAGPACTGTTGGRAPARLCADPAEGRVGFVLEGSAGWAYRFTSRTWPADCQDTQAAKCSASAGAAVTCTYSLVCNAAPWRYSTVITETYQATAAPDPGSLGAVSAAVSIRTNMTIPFGGTPVTTWLDLPANASKVWVGGAADQPFGKDGSWLAPFDVGIPVNLSYGGNGASDSPTAAATLALPLAVWLDPQGGIGLTFALSPKDPTAAMNLVVEPSVDPAAGAGRFSFVRSAMRLGGVGEQATGLTFFLVPHEADWRPGVGWYSTAFADWFEPRAPNLADARSGLWGSAAYADYRGQPADRAKLAALNMGYNWDASFPFPFWGQWLGTSSAYEACVAVGHMDPASGVPHPQRQGAPPPGVPRGPGVGQCERLSWAGIAAWYEKAREAGFATLAYANLMEWGYGLPPGAARDAAQCSDPSNGTAYCEARRLWQQFNGGYLCDHEYTVPSQWNGSQLLNGWPIAPGVKLVDPAHPPFQGYQLAALKRQLLSTPCDGVCVDRSDHTGPTFRADPNGTAWHGGVPAKWMGTSYLETTERMGALLHGEGRAFFVSATNARIDLLRHFDGIYDEFGDEPRKNFLDGLLALFKPAAGWQHAAAAAAGARRPRAPRVPGCLSAGAAAAVPRASAPLQGQAAWDAALQRHLVAGLQPTLPLQWGDHTLLPTQCGTNVSCFDFYAPYAGLFARLRKKRWLLAPAAVGAVPGWLSANAFLVADGALFVAAACGAHPGEGDNATATLTATRALGFVPGSAAALRPGLPPQPLALPPAPRPLRFALRLHRGVAAVLVAP